MQSLQHQQPQLGLGSSSGGGAQWRARPRLVAASGTRQQQQQQLGVCRLASSSSGSSCSCSHTARSRSSSSTRRRRLVTRSSPEGAPQPPLAELDELPPPRAQVISSADALSTMQEEQESQLKAMTSDMPRIEQRFEWLAFWVGAAVAFGAGIWYVQGAEKAQEFFAGYLLEQSLSIDNLFVFVLVFSYFKTPATSQPKVLSFGIITAAVLRAVMILLGTELIQKFEPLLIVFALILLWSAYGLLLSEEDDDEDLTNNAVVKFCRRVLPVTDAYDGDRFFTAAAGGARVATPLLLTLAVVEISDVLFAVDSIPAVFGVTLDPFIVYSSNMFAIFSLRSLYAFVSTVMTELRYLDKSVAIVLAFIGVKMLLEFADIRIPTDASLLVVGLVLGAGVGASLLLPEDKEEKEL